MANPMNYALIPFEGSINPRYPQGFKFYLQETRYIEKETYKLDIKILNTRYILEKLLSIAKRDGWGRLEFMITTASGKNTIFWQVGHISTKDKKHNNGDTLERKELEIKHKPLYTPWKLIIYQT